MYFWPVKVEVAYFAQKFESKKDSIKIMNLACAVLHNLCIAMGDVLPRAWDLNYDDYENKRLNGLLRHLGNY